MLGRLGLGCSPWGWSVCSVEWGSLLLFVDGVSSSDVSKSPQLVIWEREMSKRTRFVVCVWLFGACWFGRIFGGGFSVVMWFGDVMLGGLLVAMVLVFGFGVVFVLVGGTVVGFVVVVVW